MSWIWLLWIPFPGAVIMIPALCLISAAGTVRGWLRRGDSP